VPALARSEPRKINRLQRPASLEQVGVRSHAAVGIQFAGMEERVNGMIVAFIVVPDDEQDRLAADERIGDQRLASQAKKVRPCRIQVRSLSGAQPMLDCRQAIEELPAARVAFTKRPLQVHDRLP
jgi:hypothetical protein